MMVVSCDEPETVVTNYVHTDGSVTRKIEMRSIADKIEDRFVVSDLQVPFDSTWSVKDSCEIVDKGDTLWVRRAVKHFANVDDINLAYKNDSGVNKEISRQVQFKKKFKWFNTEYRFGERIDKSMLYGYPIAEFLNSEELGYFYSSENIQGEMQNGPDSLKYRAFENSIGTKSDRWMSKSIVSEWIGEFSKLTEGHAGNDMTKQALKAREDEFVNLMNIYESKFDSMWSNGDILKEFIGEDKALKFKTEADSAISTVIKKITKNFKEYSVSIVMPGKVIGTNGFIDSSQVLLWPVKSDYFLTEPYEMWAESKIPNTWAWIVSGFFLVFVLTGMIMRVIKKG